VTAQGKGSYVHADTEAAGEWLALHVFYAANPRPMMVNCIRPLVAKLTADGLLAGHFFINYWLEGPHVRLRLRPASPAHTAQVRQRTEAAIAAFLRARPALYQVRPGFLSDFYNTLFDLEYPESDRAHFEGADGRMNIRPNNTYSVEPYEPEYGKYGGPAGVELAEWHFQASSDLVIEAISSMNLHLRTVLLGTSAQLMMVMATCFLPDRDELIDYLDRYYQFWHRAFHGTSFIGSEEYESVFTEVGSPLGARFAEIRDSIGTGRLDRLPTFLRGWAEHSLDLKERARELAVGGGLVFRTWDGLRDETITDPAQALTKLLSPYLHMTNNRLHVTIRDEAYLTYVLGRSLRDHVPDPVVTAR
jgi:hypothetical protein